MIGLLGTVIGLVEAFYQIEQQGGQVQPGDLASKNLDSLTDYRIWIDRCPSHAGHLPLFR